MSHKLRPHQQEAVDQMHNGCVLYGGVGVGKSRVAIAYFVANVCKGTYDDPGSMIEPRDIYIITTAKKRDSADWEKEAYGFGISTDPKANLSGIKITVDSWNNLSKYVEVTDAFFIFDEQRVVGYGAWSRAFIKIARANQWVLLSATPGDTWMDYIPVFIANGWYKHKTDFLDQHVIWTPRVKYPKVLRYQNVGVLVRRRNEVLVHMPFERHTKRHAIDLWCDYDQEKFDKVVKKRWHVFEKRPLRDASELFAVMRKVVNADSSRLTALRGLMKEHPKLIVFYNFDYELEMLRTLGTPAPATSATTDLVLSVSQSDAPSSMRRSHSESTAFTNQSCAGDSDPLQGTIWEEAWDEAEAFRQAGLSHSAEPTTPEKTSRRSSESRSTTGSGSPSFAISEWNGHRHQEIPDTDRWVYLVQYTAGAEGWNCIETNAMCFFSQTYSYRAWWQAHGRIDRLNTPFIDLWYYNLISRSIIDRAIRKALNAKRSFNERDLDLGIATNRT